jgi:DNA-directed RNA polymerase specialized sigma24 family protein
VALTTPDPVEGSYEDFVRLHADRFGGYLRGVLGRQAEGRGGRVAVDDTLQEALLQIYAEWPELQDVHDDERDRRLYRCLRDAAGQALRAEHGRIDRVSASVRIVPFDFDRLGVGEYDELPVRERELAASVLGAMIRDYADGERETRAVIDRGILIAGLRALSEREAVVLLAIDYLRWDQHALAERLGLGFEAMRKTLFEARKVFYALVRHAAGIDADDEERGRLAAYLAGELTGPEKRVARRHLQHCKTCQALRREQYVFGRDAVGVLAPLPFFFGTKVVAKRSVVKGAGGTGGAAVGFLAQPGAAKATAIVATFLSVGVGYAAWLARDADAPRPAVGAAPALRYHSPPAGMRRITGPAPVATASRTAATKHPAAKKRHHPRKAAGTSHNTTTGSSSAIAPPAATSTASQPQQSSGTTAGKSSGSKTPSAGGWFGEGP